MIKTLLIAPYQGLAEIAKKMNKPNQLQLDVVIGNLEEGVRIARSAEKKGYQLIISRGGTAKLIEENVSIPVVSINITGYDMLRVFTLIRDIKEGVALVGFPNISEGANTICNILEYNVKMITIESKEEVRNHLYELKQNDYTVVIGDVITTQVAEEVGLRGVLITSGKESLNDAFEEGIRAYDFYKKVNNQFEFIRNIFNSFPFPVILIDEELNIHEKNNAYEEDIKDEYLLNKSFMKQSIKHVLQSNEPNWIQIEDGDYNYDLQVFPVNGINDLVGIFIHSKVRKIEDRSIIILNSIPHEPIIGDSLFAERLRSNINHYASSKETICIIGEHGTGKLTIAKEIHFQQFGQQAPFILIKGNMIDSQKLKELSKRLLKITAGTLVIENVELLDFKLQESLIKLLVEAKQMKIITLTNNKLENMVYEQKFNKDLYKKISNQALHVPPLRERKTDIKRFIKYFITLFHALEGNETLGMKEDAVEFMERYDWMGNISQLKQVVRELSTHTDGNYIDLQEVKKVLSGFYGNDPSGKLIINGTLKDMEQQIIKQVLEEENNNQSKAAERLGINRSTLWRKLKS